jgi:hypothetical protein
MNGWVDGMIDTPALTPFSPPPPPPHHHTTAKQKHKNKTGRRPPAALQGLRAAPPPGAHDADLDLHERRRLHLAGWFVVWSVGRYTGGKFGCCFCLGGQGGVCDVYIKGKICTTDTNKTQHHTQHTTHNQARAALGRLEALVGAVNDVIENRVEKALKVSRPCPFDSFAFMELWVLGRCARTDVFPFPPPPPQIY